MVRFLVPSLILSLLVGYCTGATIAAWTSFPTESLRIIDDPVTGEIPTVRLDGILNGELRGSVVGDVRIAAGGKMIPVDGSGSFRIVERSVLTNIIHVPVPTGMHFVASRRGKKYYPVGSAGANGLSPANRIYFPDEASARRAGYVK